MTLRRTLLACPALGIATRNRADGRLASGLARKTARGSTRQAQADAAGWRRAVCAGVAEADGLRLTHGASWQPRRKAALRPISAAQRRSGRSTAGPPCQHVTPTGTGPRHQRWRVHSPGRYRHVRPAPTGQPHRCWRLARGHGQLRRRLPLVLSACWRGAESAAGQRSPAWRRVTQVTHLALLRSGDAGANYSPLRIGNYARSRASVLVTPAVYHSDVLCEHPCGRDPALDTPRPSRYSREAKRDPSREPSREWLRGRASPCQGEGRGFESRLPLHTASSLNG